MNYNYEITEADYLDFNLYHMKNSSANKMVFNILCYVIPVLFALPIFLIGKNVLKQPAKYWVIISVLFVGLWILTYPKRYAKLVKRQSLKNLKSNPSADILGKKSLSFEDDTIKIVGEHSQDTINLSEIKETKIYNNLILLYLDANTAHIISISLLNSAEKEELFNKLNIKR